MALSKENKEESNYGKEMVARKNGISDLSQKLL